MGGKEKTHYTILCCVMRNRRSSSKSESKNDPTELGRGTHVNKQK
jgi:hypothetical protein